MYKEEIRKISRIGSSGGHRKFRWLSDRKVWRLWMTPIVSGFEINWKSSIPLEDLMPPNHRHRTKHRHFTQRACQGRNIGVFITECSNGHWSNASEQWRQHLREADQESLQHQKVWCPSEQYIRAITSAVRRLNGYIRAQSDRKFRRPIIGRSDASSKVLMAYAEKGTTATKRLVRVSGLYKRLTSAIFKLLEFRETSYTLKKTSKPT